MTSRTGKPCARGSGSPFMPNASMELRPSSATSSGVLIVKLLTAVLRIWSALVLAMPARSKTSFSGTPSQRAALMRLPPTSLLTQVSVMSCSTTSMSISPSKVNVTFWSTSPSTVSSQESTSTTGTVRLVSTR